MLHYNIILIVSVTILLDIMVEARRETATYSVRMAQIKL
jgi:hypothetical protein